LAEFFARIFDLVFIILLARILSPKDFGIVAMGTTFTGFLGLFCSMGLAQPTIQREKLMNAQVSVLFWLSLSIGVTLMILTMIASPWIAYFFDEPDVQLITTLLGISFVFASTETQPNALLTRRMQFARLATARFIGTLVGGSLALTSACLGAGPYSLVFRVLGTTLITFSFTWWFSGFKPSRPQRAVGVGSMIRQGGFLTGFSIINYFARHLDNILIGRFLGTAPLGLYGRVYGLTMLPISLVTAPLAGVILSTLSKLQNDRARLEKTYVKILRFVSILSFPIGMGMFLSAEELTIVLFGEAWEDSIPALRWLALCVVFQPLNYNHGNLYITAGQTHKLFWWGLLSSLLIILCFIIGIYGGSIESVARAYALGITFLFIPGLTYAFRAASLSVRPALLVFMRPLACTLGMAGCILFANVLLPLPAPKTVSLLVAKIFLGVISYTALLCLICRPEVRELFDMIRSQFPRKLNSPPPTTRDPR
jgi:PST family polysaccharide transporter